MESDVGRFVSAISKPPGLWRSIDIRALFLHIGGEWHNLATNCFLDSRLANEVPRYLHLPATTHLRARQVVLAMAALEGILDQVSRGLLDLDDIKVEYVGLQPNDEKRPYTSSFYSFLSLSGGQGRTSRAWACHRLIAAGGSCDALLGKLSVRSSELDDTLRALHHPFDGLDGLASVFLGESGLVGSSRSTVFQVEAPIRARFDPAECRLEDGKLHFTVFSESKAIAELSSVGYIGNRRDLPPLSESLNLSGPGWSPIEGMVCNKGNCQVPGVHRLSLFLRVGDWPVDRMVLVDPASGSRNPRIEAYKVFDPDLDLVREWLNAEHPVDSSAFEKGVTRLLTLLGFSVDALSGDRRLGDAPDMIAFTDVPSVILAVECTTGAIDAGGKLGKLVRRAKQVEAALPESEVIPVLVTATPRMMIAKADLNAAAEDRVIVVAREDLSELLEKLTEKPTPSSTIDFLKSRASQGSWASLRQNPG